MSLTSAEISANVSKTKPRGFQAGSLRVNCQMTDCDGCKRTRFCLLLDNSGEEYGDLHLCQDCISTLFHSATIIPAGEKR